MSQLLKREKCLLKWPQLLSIVRTSFRCDLFPIFILASRNVPSPEGSEQHSGSGVLWNRSGARRRLHGLQSGRQGVRHSDGWRLRRIYDHELHVRTRFGVSAS